MIERLLLLSRVQDAYLKMSESAYVSERASNAQKKVMIVLGHNMGPLSGPDDIEKDGDHLSIYSKISAKAAGILLKEKKIDVVIFSTGHTSGKHIRSEAHAMKDYLLKQFKEGEVDANSILLEAESLDTKGNARESMKLAESYGFKNIAMMTTGDHFEGAFKTFNRNGFDLRREKCLRSEEIVADYLEVYIKDLSPERRISREEFLRAVKERDILGLTQIKEFLRDFWMETFDYDATILNKIAEFTRG